MNLVIIKYDKGSDVDFKRLKTFRIVARLLSFSAAANQLGYVQSAVTGHIKVLEDSLGVMLFDRNGRSVRLTPAGITLLNYSDKLFALREEAIQEVTLSDELGGTLNISGHETVLSYRLPVLLDRFSKNYPKIKLTIIPTDIGQLKNRLLNNDLDVIFTLEEPFEHADIECYPLLIEKVVIIANIDHPLASKKNILPKDLNNESLLLTDAGCSYRKRFEETLKKHNVNNDQTFEFSSIELIKSCAKLGTGIAAISNISVEKEINNNELAVLDWKGEDLSVPLFMLWSNKRTLSKHIQTFIRLIQDN